MANLSFLDRWPLVNGILYTLIHTLFSETLPQARVARYEGTTVYGTYLCETTNVYSNSVVHFTNVSRKVFTAVNGKF